MADTSIYGLDANGNSGIRVSSIPGEDNKNIYVADPSGNACIRIFNEDGSVGGIGSYVWGAIQGDLTTQADLKTILDSINTNIIPVNLISSGTTNTIYYIDGTNGDDTTGDGSQLTPWKTLEHCLKTIPSIIENRTDIVLAAGSYTVTAEVNNLLHWFTILDGSLRIYGTMSLVRDDFQASTQTLDANNPFERVVSGMTWDANTYTGNFVSDGNVERYMPIGKHGANSLNYAFTTNYTKGIYECLTTLVLERSLLCPQNSSGAFFVKNMIVDVNSDNTMIIGSESCSTNFNSCVINCKTYVSFQTFGSADYWRCAFIGTSTATALTNGIYQLNKTNKHQRGSFKACSFISMNDQRGTGLESLGQDIYIQDIQFQGFETAMYLRNGLSVYVNTVYNASSKAVLAVDNCKSFVYMVGSGFNWNLTDLFQVYFKNLSYGFCLHPYTTNNMQLDFRNIIQNGATPSIAWLNPTCYVPSLLVDLSRNFILLYPGCNFALIDRALSHTYVDDGDEVAIAVPPGDAPVKYTLPVTPGYTNKFGVYNPGQPTQSLQYQGDDPIVVSIESSSSLISSVNNCRVTFYAYKNGSPIPGCSIQRKIGTGADAGALALTSLTTLNKNDLLEIYVSSDMATNLTLYKTNFVIEEIMRA